MHSEILCYVQNHFGCSSKDNLITLLTGFYNEEEIVAAKNVLFSVTDNMPTKLEGLPRHIKRQAGDSKKQQDCDDMLKLFRFLDQAKVELPRFMAGDLSRLPKVKPGEVDIYNMAVTIANLTQQVQMMASRLVALETSTQPAGALYRQEFPSPAESVSRRQHGDRTHDTLQSASESAVSAEITNDVVSWSDVAGYSIDAWKKVEYKNSVRASAPIRVKGSRQPSDISDKLKAVPRRPVLAAFAGRFHRDTTEENLHQFLSNVGMKDVRCKKLKSKDGTVFKTAAFYVTCSTESRDLFYDDSCWPEGVELRDWIYRNRERS